MLAACDIRVLVFDFDGKPLDAKVKVIRTNKPPLERISHAGVAEFCDVGLGLLDVTVGLEMCGQVKVRMLEIVWGKTLTIPVYHRNCHSHTLFQGCTVLLRVLDQAGLQVSGASVTPYNGTPQTSDEYGRIQFGVLEESYRAFVRAPGFRDEAFDIACGPNRSSVEKTLVLRKAQ